MVQPCFPQINEKFYHIFRHESQLSLVGLELVTLLVMTSTVLHLLWERGVLIVSHADRYVTRFHFQHPADRRPQRPRDASAKQTLLLDFFIWSVLFITTFINFFRVSFVLKPGQRSWYSDWLRAGRLRVRNSSSDRAKNFHLSMSSIPVTGPTQPPIQWV
jgi:hypothetical protein